MLIYPVLLVVAIAIGGCGTTAGERAGSGALMGAAGGSLSADAGKGALGGYLFDQHQKGNID